MRMSPAIALGRAELLRNLRSSRPFMFMGLLMLIGWFTVWVNWPTNGSQLSALGRAAVTIHAFFIVTIAVSAGLFVPALAGTAIVREREEETFDLLILTLIPPKGLILAKLANAAGLFLLITVGAIPVIASVLFMVGLDIAPVLLSAVVLIVSAISVGVIGLAASAYCRRTMPALILAYLATAFLMGGHDFIVIAAEEAGNIPLLPISVNSRTFTDIAIATSPPLLLASMYDNWFTWRGFWWAALYHSFIIVGCLVLTVVFLRRGPRRPPIERADTRWLPALGRRMRPIRDYANPMTIKEIQWGLLKRRGRTALWFVSLFVFVIITMVIVDEWNLYGYSRPNSIDRFRQALNASFATTMPILLCVAPLFLVNLFTKERETHNLDMLRVTLLTPRQVVLGKIWAATRAMVPLFVTSVIGLLPFSLELIFLGGEDIILRGIASTAVSLLFVMGLAAYFGTRARHTGTALVGTYAIGLLAFIGFPVLVALFCDFLHVPGREAEYFIGLLSPYISWIVHLAEYERDHTGLMGWYCVLASYTCAAVALIASAITRYARTET